MRGLPAVLVASVSIALYYNITFFGKALVALPSLPVASGCLLYYLSAFNTTSPIAQVALWMLSFGLVGAFWWYLLNLALQRFCRGVAQEKRAWAVSRVQRALWVYSLPLPWLLWVHAQSPEGASSEALIGAILVRDRLYWNSVGSENVLNALFLVLAATESALSVWAVHRACGRPKATFTSLTSAGLVLLLLVCLLAQIFYALH